MGSPLDGGTVRPIRTAGDPVLAQRAAVVGPATPGLLAGLRDLAATLADFRARAGFGRAISAPQIGLPWRAIALDLGAGPRALLNPEITWRSAATQWVWDDCLSVPDTLVRLERAASVTVRYTDELGRAWTWERLPPDLAELLQHEIDHLDGVLMTDRAAAPGDRQPMRRRAELVDAARPAPRITPTGILAAAADVDPRYLDSPLFEAEALSERLGCRVWLKVETLNPVRCFKGRGASVLVARLARNDPGAVVAAASAGNWGQALAHACRHRGLPLVLFAAETANPYKVARIRSLGAEVRLVGADFDAAKAAARAEAAHRGWTFAEDGYDATVTEGHGSCAREILDHFDRRRDACHDLLVPLGNGALVNGIGAWARAASPATRVVAVSAEGAPAMHESFLAGPGGPVARHDTVATIADGLAVREPVPEAVADMHHAVHESRLVTDAHLSAAADLLEQEAGVVAEPAGAAGLAAVLADPERFRGRTVVAIVTGSNRAPGGVAPLGGQHHWRANSRTTR